MKLRACLALAMSDTFPGPEWEFLKRALYKLQQIDRRQAKVVELRIFGGLDDDQIAATLNINCRTVKREWHVAKAWLYAEFRDDGPAGTSGVRVPLPKDHL